MVSEGIHPSPSRDKSPTRLLVLFSLSDSLILHKFLGEVTINLEQHINLAHIKAIPFGPLPWTCDNYGLVLFSVVAECKVYNKSSLLLS